MSEQTPDTENGMADGQDPSMEDILASIRKIIAEDDEQTSAGSATKTPEVAIDTSDLINANTDFTAQSEVSGTDPIETLDLDVVVDESSEIDTNIDALIGDMDATAPDSLLPKLMPASSAGASAADGVLDLEIPMDEAEVLAEVDIAPTDTLQLDDSLVLDDEIIELVEDSAPDQDSLQPISDKASTPSLMDGALAALGLGGAAAVATTAKSEPETDESSAADDDLSLMLDNLLGDSDPVKEELLEPTEEIVEEKVVDPASHLIKEDLLEADLEGDDILAEFDLSEDSPVVISDSDPDIDLVKTLMADLTEAPLHDPADPEVEDVSSVVDAPIIQAVEAAPVINEDVIIADSDISEDDIMDEILSVTIEEEAKLSEEVLVPAPNESVSETQPSETLSLKDIAAAAEADAVAAEAGLPADELGSDIADGASAAIVGAAALTGVAAIANTDGSAEAEESPEIDLVAELPLVDEAEASDQDDIDQALSNLDSLLTDEQPAEQEDFTPETTIVEKTTSESITEETSTMAITSRKSAKKTDAIIDEVTESATAGAFASLSTVVEEKAVTAERGDRIGDLVMEALQPMLKEWLDANLKGIVERAVTKEVKRISSGK